MRKWILHIHLYGLLLCSGKIIIFGASSIDFNHRQFFAQSDTTKVLWQKNIDLDAIHPDSVLVVALRDSLDLTVGWHMPWRTYRDSLDVFHTAFARPGRQYILSYFPKEHLVKVEEERKGLGEITGGLHVFWGFPGSILLSPAIWWWYTEICTLFVIFGAISGVYLWTTRKTERTAGYIILIVSSIMSGLLILYLWLIG